MKTIETYLTKEINLKKFDASFIEVMESLCFSAKNIYNATLFILRNVYLAYEYNKDSNTYRLKENLHIHQQTIINLLNQTIIQLNSNYQEKFDKAEEEHDVTTASDDSAKKPTKLKVLQPFEQEISQSTFYQLVNKSLIENALRLKEQNDSYKDYTVTPSHIAQASLQKAVAMFSLYFKAIKSYYINKESFTGKPALPQFLKKNALYGFELDNTRFGQNGNCMSLKKSYQLYSNQDKTSLLSDEVTEKYNKLNIKELIGLDFKTFRITPIKQNRSGKRIKLEVVMVNRVSVKENTLLHAVLQTEPEFVKKKSKIQQKLIQDIANENKELTVMGIDFGLRNLCTMATNNGKNLVLGGKILNNKLKQFDIKLDARKASLANEKVKKLLLNKTDNTDKDGKEVKLTPEQIKELHQFQKAIYQDKEYLQLLVRKDNFVNDVLHKVSKAIVEESVKRKTDLLVLGKNQLWKQDCSMGKESNRAFHNLPHARLIELIQYKALQQGICVLLQEESYTSQASFIHGDRIPVYSKEQVNNQTFTGKRKSLHYLLGKKRIIHADINGAFNIIRKALNWFTYKKKVIQLSYRIVDIALRGKQLFRNLENHKPELFSGFGLSTTIA